MRSIVIPLALGALLLLGDEPPQGLPPRPDVSDYAAKTEWQKVTLAASLVPSKQVEHLFAFDISRSFLVFEVACYADSSAAFSLSREGFVVKTKPGMDAVRHSDPETVASAIERQNQPSFPSEHGADVETIATVGIAHGTDPNTRRSSTGVYTGGQVSVESGPRDRMPPPSVKPGGTAEDRVMLAAQLRARTIPEGLVHHAVAGYIYFRRSDVKLQSDGTYQLQYVAQEEGGATHALSLPVPAKAH